MESNETTALEQSREFTEVVGLFDSLDKLQSAIDNLMTHGFDRSEISLLTEDAKTREKIGSKRSVEIEDSDEAPRISYIEAESLNEGKAALIGLLFYVGAIAGAIAIWTIYGSFAEAIVAGIGAGMAASLVGVGVGAFIRRRQRNWVQAQLARGWLPQIQSDSANFFHGRLPRVRFNTSTLAHRGRRGASTPSEPFQQRASRSERRLRYQYLLLTFSVSSTEIVAINFATTLSHRSPAVFPPSRDLTPPTVIP